MSSPPNPTPPSPPKTFDNSRLPAYRSSYLSRYHPYPRTRAPAREVVMSAAESEHTEENNTPAAENTNTVNLTSGQQ